MFVIYQWVTLLDEQITNEILYSLERFMIGIVSLDRGTKVLIAIVIILVIGFPVWKILYQIVTNTVDTSDVKWYAPIYTLKQAIIVDIGGDCFSPEAHRVSNPITNFHGIIYFKTEDGQLYSLKILQEIPLPWHYWIRCPYWIITDESIELTKSMLLQYWLYIWRKWDIYVDPLIGKLYFADMSLTQWLMWPRYVANLHKYGIIGLDYILQEE
jgi:hypothetical protein